MTEESDSECEAVPADPVEYQSQDIQRQKSFEPDQT